MAYEYEKENKEAVMINPPKANKELKEVYRKAQAFDNYMVDLAKTIELYPHDYDKYNNFAKETYEFYMQDKEDFIKGYENEVGHKHELIHDVEEYDRILSDLEGK